MGAVEEGIGGLSSGSGENGRTGSRRDGAPRESDETDGWSEQWLKRRARGRRGCGGGGGEVQQGGVSEMQE